MERNTVGRRSVGRKTTVDQMTEPGCGAPVVSCFQRSLAPQFRTASLPAIMESIAGKLAFQYAGDGDEANDPLGVLEN